MKRAISIMLAIALICAMTTGCGKTETENPITEVKVTLPQSTGTRAVVEGEAVITTQLYLLVRAYSEKLETFDTENFDAQEYSRLVAEASEAFRIAEAFCASLETHAAALAEIEENASVQQEKATYELLSASSGDIRYFPFVTVAYAAEEKSPAIRYAEELTRTFDNAKNGQKLKAVAEKYGTDVKKAKAMLEQAQAILEGDAYTDQAEFENKCYEAAVETKAAASNIGFGLSLIATGGTVSGVIEAGGILCGGLQAMIDTGTAASIHVTNGEGNVYTEFFEKAEEALAPISAFFSIGNGIQNIIDIRNPEKAAEAVNNAAQAFLTGVGFARDYVQEGKVLGVSSNIIDGYREIIVRSADTSKPEAAKEVLTKTGVSPEALESAEDASGNQGVPGAKADAYIEAFGGLVDPADPIDVEAVIENIDAEFTEYALSEGIVLGDVAKPVPALEESSDAEEGDEVTDDTSMPRGGSALSAHNVAGAYYFAELEDSVNMAIEATDDTHLTVLDVNCGESIIGGYDETTGTFHAVLSEKFSWYVTIVFTDTGNGIRADYENSLGGMVVTSSAMKNS